MTTNISEDMKLQIEAVIEEARRISVDVSQEVEEIFKQGNERPLEQGKTFELLTKIISVLKRKAGESGDDATSNSLAGDINQIIQRVIQMREPVISESIKATAPTKIKLVRHNGIDPRPRKKRFQGVEVQMKEGYVNTRDIPLWIDNPRTEIELARFRKENNGRDPNPEQRLEIMWRKKDIEELAKDIALDGVHTPPIIAVDGRLLDGNRRIAACQYILHNKDKKFDDEAFKNAEYILIWQLEHATEDDERRVIAARNFASDHKKDWTKYTRAKEVYKVWQEMSSRSCGKINNTEIRKILAREFGNIQPTQVKKYIETMEFVQIFRDYHIDVKGEDIYDVEDVVDTYYAYLEKIASSKAGGVKDELENNEAVKELIFDLLFDGKFTKDEQFNVGDLKRLITDSDALEKLEEAQKETDKETAQEMIENEINRIKSNKKPTKKPKLEKQVKDCIKTLDLLNVRQCEEFTLETLKSLLQTLKSVQPMLEEICKQKDEV